MKNSRWRPVFALETGGPPNADGEDFEEDSGFLGRTRLGRLVQAAGRQLLEKLNSARSNSPTKIFLVLLGFYTANALATILGASEKNTPVNRTMWSGFELPTFGM